MLSIFICKIICEVLADRQHEGWAMVFDFFFTNDEGVNLTYQKRVADAVTDMICEYLPDDVVLHKPDVDLLYALYSDYADEFEERVREEIPRKVYGDILLPCIEKGIAEIEGVSIKRLYEVYARAIERAQEKWKEDCIVEQDENDFKPLEVLLCVAEGEVWSYYDLPWKSDTGWSEKMFHATRIDLLDGEYTPIDGTQFYEEEGLSEEEQKEYDRWAEEVKDGCSLSFKSFDEVIEDLLNGNIFNH